VARDANATSSGKRLKSCAKRTHMSESDDALFPVLDTAGNQIAWIDHMDLEVGGLFRIGA
jgi:hypothetical protein